jgi:hypothetical protein
MVEIKLSLFLIKRYGVEVEFHAFLISTSAADEWSVFWWTLNPVWTVWGTEKSPAPTKKLKPRFLGFPARNLISITNTPFQLTKVITCYIVLKKNFRNESLGIAAIDRRWNIDCCICNDTQDTQRSVPGTKIRAISQRYPMCWPISDSLLMYHSMIVVKCPFKFQLKIFDISHLQLHFP